MSLETMDGKSVTGDVIVELKELMNQQSFATAETPTVSNGNLLASGGAYSIGMQSTNLRFAVPNRLTSHLLNVKVVFNF